MITRIIRDTNVFLNNNISFHSNIKLDPGYASHNPPQEIIAIYNVFSDVFTLVEGKCALSKVFLASNLFGWYYPFL